MYLTSYLHAHMSWNHHGQYCVLQPCRSVFRKLCSRFFRAACKLIGVGRIRLFLNLPRGLLRSRMPHIARTLLLVPPLAKSTFLPRTPACNRGAQGEGSAFSTRTGCAAEGHACPGEAAYAVCRMLRVLAACWWRSRRVCHAGPLRAEE